MRRRITWLVLLAIFASPADGAAAQDVSAVDRFELFNECGPMRLIVRELPAHAAEIGLTEESIQSAVESRLRAARLYDADAGPSFYVNVHVDERVFVLTLNYRKGVYDPISAEFGLATTWVLRGAGTHGRDGAMFILSGLASYMDRFLVEYLRVNESACD